MLPRDYDTSRRQIQTRPLGGQVDVGDGVTMGWSGTPQVPPTVPPTQPPTTPQIPPTLPGLSTGTGILGGETPPGISGIDAIADLLGTPGIATPGTPQEPSVVNPWENPFMEVYETTKTGAMKNLEEMQKKMQESFAHRGGYFGGQHAIAQAELGEKTGTALDQLLSQVSLGASERAYQDWLRARQETMMPFNMVGPLLGQQTTQPLVTQQPSAWGGIASAIGPALGAAIGKSSERFKKDIYLLDEIDESKIFEEMAEVPIFRYKYKSDPEEKERIGLISERAPKEITFLEDTFVGLYEYIGMLHAAVKELSRKVQKLEDN